MNLETRRNLLRIAFIAMATLGLFLNLAFDVVAYNFRQDQWMETSMMTALFLDGFLIFVLLGLFILNYQNRKQIEDNLKESVNTMRDTLRNLEQENLKQKIVMKTTVHDLKNPIGSIYGFAEILEDSAGSQESVLQFSEMIKKISQRSLTLVESLLTDENTTAPTFEKVDLVAVIMDVCDQLQVQATQKSQTLIREFAIPRAEVFGHRLKLDELVTNLLGNAIKYSPKSQAISIRCLEKNSKWRIEIEDHGPGFTAVDKAQAFQFGQKLSAKPTHHESSTGFGLFAAKRIVQLHKGSIEILDAKTKPGACLVFELPKAEAETSSRALTPPENETSAHEANP